MTTFRFTGRATGDDREGYYYRRWDQAQPVSVLAESKGEALVKAKALFGTHPRHGVRGFGDSRDWWGWALVWDSIEEVAPAAPIVIALEGVELSAEQAERIRAVIAESGGSQP